MHIHHLRSPLLGVFLLMGLGVPSGVLAQPAGPAAAGAAQPPAAAEPEAGEEAASDSPRASLQAYLLAARAGQWDVASRYLLLPAERRGEAPALAEQLKGVLDQHLWFDLESISGEPRGRRDDGLSANLEEIGRIPVGASHTEPVRLIRTSDQSGAFWAFSPATVARISAWYQALPDRWLRDLLVEARADWLLLPGPFELLRWQWIALPLIVILVWLAGRLLARMTRAVFGRLVAHTSTGWDDLLFESVGPPLTIVWALLGFVLVLPWLDLTPPAARLLRSLAAAAGFVALFWTFWRAVGASAEKLLTQPWAATSPSARNLLAVGATVAKAAIVAMAAVAALSALGYPAATLLAGLGIGGLAFAFGAQKTVENLFGSVSLAVDRPFAVGDFVKVEDFVGTVENIGLRSTRFRTLDRTLISIPNGKLADQRLESFAVRDRMRLATTIGVEYGTSRAQMQQVLEGFERVLREHPKIWPDAMVVKFREFGASSLDIEIMAWFQVPTWADFQQCRQEVLLGFMRVVEEAGTGFAFPTRTVHLVNQPAPPAPDSLRTGAVT